MLNEFDHSMIIRISELANNKATLLAHTSEETIQMRRTAHKDNLNTCFTLLHKFGANQAANNWMEELRNTTDPSSLSLGTWWEIISETTSLPANTRLLNADPSLTDVFALPLNQISPLDSIKLQQALGDSGIESKEKNNKEDKKNEEKTKDKEMKEEDIPVSSIVACLFAASLLPGFKKAKTKTPRTVRTVKVVPELIM